MSSSRLLLYFSILGMLCCLATMFIQNEIGLYCLVLVSLFLSIMFPTIYGIALNGLSEEDSKIGAAGLVMAIVGGALLPQLQGILIDLGGSAVNDISILGVSEINFSFILPAVCFLLIAFYSIGVYKGRITANQ